MEKPPSEQQNLPEIRRARGSYTRLRARVTAWLDGRDVSDQVKECLLLLPDLFALLIRLMGDPRVDKSLRAQLAIVSVYEVSPIDLIPDFILPVGLIDDTVALAFIITRVVKIMGETGEDILCQHWEGQGDVLAQLQNIARTADRLLNERVLKRLGKLFK